MPDIQEIKKRHEELVELSNKWRNDKPPAPLKSFNDLLAWQVTHIATYDPKKDYELMFKKAQTVWEKQEVIRKYYLDNQRWIIELASTQLLKSFNINAFDWPLIFSPIEMDAWYFIRCSGIVLYPQYPALNYMLDFGNPYLGIALELDGKEYHDRVKDKIRDQRLYNEVGWKVFRVTGSEAKRDILMPSRYPDEYDSDAWHELQEFMYNTVDGVIEAIKQVYFFPKKTESFEERRYYDLCIDTLNYHRLADFPIP